MNKQKFCFVGDLHLEALDKYYKKETNPNRFIYEQLDKVVAYCRKADIKNVFQLGDVFDHPYPDQKSIKEFLEFLHKNADLNFYIIAGNHDYSNVRTNSLEIGSFLTDVNLINNVRIFTKPQHLLIEGIDVFFAPYPTHKKFESLVGTPCLCLGHFEVKGAKHDSGQLIKNGVSSEELHEEDSWILGHLHRQQRISDKIYYTGTMLQYNFGEPLPKGFVVADITQDAKKLKVKHNYVQLETPYSLLNVDVNSLEDIKTLQLNDPKFFYKLFINDNQLILPKRLVDGTTTNIYKILHNSNATSTERTLTASLSEAFHEDSDKERLFEPLGGLEDHLTQEGLTPEEVQETLLLVQNLKHEFNPKRN